MNLPEFPRGGKKLAADCTLKLSIANLRRKLFISLTHLIERFHLEVTDRVGAESLQSRSHLSTILPTFGPSKMERYDEMEYVQRERKKKKPNCLALRSQGKFVLLFGTRFPRHVVNKGRLL